jgi:hypothetical protein
VQEHEVPGRFSAELATPKPMQAESPGLVTPLAHIGQWESQEDHTHASAPSLFQSESDTTFHQQMASHLHEERGAPHPRLEPERSGHIEPGVDERSTMMLSRPLEALGNADAFDAGFGFRINEESVFRMAIVERPSTSPKERAALLWHGGGIKNTDARAEKIESILQHDGYRIIGSAQRRFREGATLSAVPISIVEKNGHLFCIRHVSTVPDGHGTNFDFRNQAVRLVTRDEILAQHRKALGAFDKAVAEGKLSHMLGVVLVDKEDGSIKRIVIARLIPYRARYPR